MTFSFHVWASEEIKLYLYWKSQCHRFYPEDVIGVLPKIFNMNQENKDFIESDDTKRLLDQMEISDRKFEEFYRRLHHLQKSSFPKKYDLPKPVYPMEKTACD